MTSKKIDVTKDRDKYIGGSDIPIIMGLSPFRSRWDLLQEKALGKVSDFSGNEYTEYGKTMEPIIRNYINDTYNRSFVDDTSRIDGDIRYHADGWEKSNEWWEDEGTVLEIKTTGKTFQQPSRPGDFAAERKFLEEHYKQYLVQLLVGMRMYHVRLGLLAVYERPSDFSTEFEEFNLDWFTIRAEEWADLYAEIDRALDAFRRDCEKLKANPDLDEAGLMGTDMAVLASNAVQAVRELAVYDAEVKQAEKKAKAAKDALYKAMNAADVESWTMKDGTKVTRVKEKPDTLIDAIDEDLLRDKFPDIADVVTTQKMKRGRKGYVLITLPKDEEV